MRRSFEGASQHYWITRETWSPRFCPAFLTAGCHIFDIQHHYFICLDGARRSPGSFQATTTTSKSCRTATYSHLPLLAFAFAQQRITASLTGCRHHCYCLVDKAAPTASRAVFAGTEVLSTG